MQFIGVASRDDAEAINGFVEEFSVNGFEHVIDLDGVIWEHFGVVSQPAFTFINDDGTVDTHVGALGEDGLLEAIENLRST